MGNNDSRKHCFFRMCWLRWRSASYFMLYCWSIHSWVKKVSFGNEKKNQWENWIVWFKYENWSKFKLLWFDSNSRRWCKVATMCLIILGTDLLSTGLQSSWRSTWKRKKPISPYLFVYHEIMAFSFCDWIKLLGHYAFCLPLPPGYKFSVILLYIPIYVLYTRT